MFVYSGTLTCNRMSVSHVVYGNEITSTPITPVLEGDDFKQFDTENSCFIALQRIVSLNTDAVFLSQEEDVLARTCKGDASESALIKFVEPIRPINEYRAACARKVAIPFNSSNKWMLSINEQEGPEKNSLPLMLFIKGAPERVLAMCTTILTKEGVIVIDEEMRTKLEIINESLASRGERVLGFAQRELNRTDFPVDYVFDAESNPPNFPTNDLTFVGFVSLIDPPRMSVRPAIQQCNTAGIQVYMVTGDHPVTAHAIAKSLNIITGPTAAELKAKNLPIPVDGCKAIVVHGTDMNSFSPIEWRHVLSHKEIVFARTMPQQKQDIVRELNKLGHIVAMTGNILPSYRFICY